MAEEAKPEDVKVGDLCPKCKKNPRREPHRCPYQSDINGDDDPEYCMCCEECTGQCAGNI